MNRALRATLVLAALVAGGCASGPIGQYQSSLEIQMAVRSAALGSASVGEFTVAPTLAAAADKSVSVRGHRLSSPVENSFAQYLRGAMLTELRTAGLLAESTPVVISGRLTDNRLDAGGTTKASGELGAEFSVTAAGKLVYSKPVKVRSDWAASFMGAIAIPEAINQYTALYRKLLAALFADEEFRKALQPAG